MLNEKADAIYYHGAQPVLKNLIVTTVATDTGKSTVQVTAELEGTQRYYACAADSSTLPGVTFGTAITVSNWTAMTGAAEEITPATGDTLVRVVEVNGSGEPIACGDAILNIG